MLLSLEYVTITAVCYYHYNTAQKSFQNQQVYLENLEHATSM